jgi:diguanylate cyclase (GGDEF)-like protein
MTNETSPSRAEANSGAERRALYSVAQIQHLLRVEFQRAQRYAYPLSCLLVSVDQLGDVRDRGGYEAKERVLESIVQLVSSCTRASDFLGRTADDRLLVVVPHTGRDGLGRLAARLIAAAHASQASRPLHEAAAGRLTLSVGWAATDAGSFAFHDALLSRAEAAHSDAVTQGGDRAQGPQD